MTTHGKPCFFCFAILYVSIYIESMFWNKIWKSHLRDKIGYGFSILLLASLSKDLTFQLYFNIEGKLEITADKPAPNYEVISRASAVLKQYGQWTWNEKEGHKHTKQEYIYIYLFFYIGIPLVTSNWSSACPLFHVSVASKGAFVEAITDSFSMSSCDENGIPRVWWWVCFISMSHA